MSATSLFACEYRRPVRRRLAPCGAGLQHSGGTTWPSRTPKGANYSVVARPMTTPTLHPAGVKITGKTYITSKCMNLAIIIAGITWNARRKGRSMAPTDRPYGGRGVEGGEPLPNLMTFTCGAGAHYNILYGLSRLRSWSAPPPADRQGLT